MTHLTPEKRMDRNGKLVTKHVRSAPSATSGASKIPAPSMGGGKVAITKERRPIYKDIMQGTGTAVKMKNEHWDYVRQYLAPLSDNDLSELQSAMKHGSQFNHSINMKYFKIAIRSGHVMNAVKSYNDLMSGVSKADYEDPHMTLGGVMLGGAERLLNHDWTIPEGRRDAIRTRLLATQTIIESVGYEDGSVKKSPIGSYHLESFELNNFINENADRGDEIVAGIRSRKSTDPGMLRELMDHDVKSLNDGVL